MLHRLHALRHLPSTPLPRGLLQPRSSLFPGICQSPNTFSTRSLTTTRLNSWQTPFRRPATRSSRWHTQTAKGPRRSRYNSTNNGPAQDQTPQKKPGRLAELARKYGWAAFGVYMALSALDFPFCFLAVRWIGTERIAEAEHFIVSNFWRLVGTVFPSMEQSRKVTATPVGEALDNNSAELEPHRNHEGASLWTQLLLAYGVHKSLIVFRVPLTAAILPKVVKFLRARGWNIGRTKAEKIASQVKP